MKKMFFGILLISIFQIYVLYGKNDSTSISFRYGFENKEVAILADFMNVSKISFEFDGDNLLNKLVIFSIDEYKDGKLIESKPFFKCRNKNIKSNNSKTIDLPDPCEDYMKYTGEFKEYIFNFIIKMINSDTALFRCNYPTNMTYNKLVTDFPPQQKIVMYPMFNKRFPLNRKKPFIAITTGYHQDMKNTYYCTLLSKPVEQWYNAFDIKHYYVIYLEIK